MLDDALHLTPTEKLALADIKRRVSALFPVHEYILFGSKPRGDWEGDLWRVLPLHQDVLSEGIAV